MQGGGGKGRGRGRGGERGRGLAITEEDSTVLKVTRCVLT